MDRGKRNRQEVIQRLKVYLERLGKEKPEEVRADFVKEFDAVDANEIVQAEQALLAEGTPLEEVQRLCDVHAALFQGRIRPERASGNDREKEREDALAAYRHIQGHPLGILLEENAALTDVVTACRKAIREGMVSDALFQKLREVSVHYAKKGDLLYPHLRVQYGITGPSAVMWTVDDEIRDALAALEDRPRDETWMEQFDAVVTRIDEMIYKEENILFPNCIRNFTEKEWYGIYEDAKDYKECFGVKRQPWLEAETVRKEMQLSGREDEVVLAGGHLTVEQLDAVFNTIPLEITFVDEQDRNCYFNAGTKVFKRPGMAIGREVFSCHPPKVEQKVRRILDDFRNGVRDSVPVWMVKNDRCMLVTYLAVRNRQGSYIGTLELVQDMEFARTYFAGRNL